MDIRFGLDQIKSRAGLQNDADILIRPDTNLLDLPLEQRKVSCVLVDEAQFLAPGHIDQLRLITTLWKVPVICFGLRTDFRANLFPGSRRLMELADSIEEVKTTCYFCNSQAVFNLKHVNGIADCTGPAVQLGAEEKYFPTCFDCYRSSLLDADQMPADAHWHDPEKQQKGSNVVADNEEEELESVLSGMSLRAKGGEAEASMPSTPAAKGASEEEKQRDVKQVSP